MKGSIHVSGTGDRPSREGEGKMKSKETKEGKERWLKRRDEAGKSLRADLGADHED